MTIEQYLKKSQHVISRAEKDLKTNPVQARKALAMQVQQHIKLLSRVYS